MKNFLSIYVVMSLFLICIIVAIIVTKSAMPLWALLLMPSVEITNKGKDDE